MSMRIQSSAAELAAGILCSLWDDTSKALEEALERAANTSGDLLSGTYVQEQVELVAAIATEMRQDLSNSNQEARLKFACYVPLLRNIAAEHAEAKL